MKAIEKTLAQRRFDEIILSTLPPGISGGCLGPPTSCPSQNRCSADGHHFAKQRR